MNNFLKTRAQVDAATKWLKEGGLTESGLSCKNWELAEATMELESANILDMGADGSYVLHNAVKMGLDGRKVGIDLLEVIGANRADGVEYFQGDLMNTKFEDDSFDMIFSLSVIEHEVNFDRFAKEVSRLLRVGGELIVSFDYWPVKPDTSNMRLYSLDWNILDRRDVTQLLLILSSSGLFLSGDLNWETQDAVINPSYCSPAKGISYTFGILKFIKK